MIIYLIGFMGSGKSYLAKELAELTHSSFVDLDQVIIAHEGVSISSIFENHGEQYFRNLESDLLRSITQDVYNRELIKGQTEQSMSMYTFVACGGGTPCFNENMDWMNEHGLTVWVNPSSEVLVERLEKEKSQRPLIAALDLEGLKQFIQVKLNEREAYYSKAKVTIHNTHIPVEEIFKSIIHA
jgi:shikimate kinase